MEITSLHTYPVKGCHRLDHDEAAVEPWGLAGDRRWMVVDEDGVGITQRITGLLTGLTAVTGAGAIRLSAAGRPDLRVPEPVGGRTEFVRVFSHKTPVPAWIAGAGTAGWLSALLQRPARLAWLGDPTARTIDSHARPDDRVSFADGFPVLLANTASLSALNDWLVEVGEEPVPMTRFRPNLVLAGAPAWAEDGWIGTRLRIGRVDFRVAKNCARCVVTTIDQETGVGGREPLRMLGARRRIGSDLVFAVNLIPDIGRGLSAVLRRGDGVLRLP